MNREALVWAPSCVLPHLGAHADFSYWEQRPLMGNGRCPHLNVTFLCSTLQCAHTSTMCYGFDLDLGREKVVGKDKGEG